MKIVNGKKFYAADIKAARRIDGNGWDSYNGQNWQWYSLFYNPACGLVILKANNSGDCYGDYTDRYFENPEAFRAWCEAHFGHDWAALLGKIDGHNVLGNVFPDCDFSILDSDCDMENESLECIASGANAWYGVKAIDAGFDSECLMLISDYYGGGCASMATFFDDCNQYYSISDTILNLILDTLHCSEAATKDTLLIVEIR